MNNKCIPFLITVFLLTSVVLFFSGMEKLKLEEQISQHQIAIDSLENELEKKEYKIKERDKFLKTVTQGKKIILTAYTPEPEQTDDTPYITATGDSVKIGGLALSRELIKQYNINAELSYGDSVLVLVAMEFEVNDTMNKRYTSRGDVFFYDTPKAYRFGLHVARLISFEELNRTEGG